MYTYNHFVSQVLRANNYFSLITLKYAVLHYIAKYALKSEAASVPYKELLSGILNKRNETNQAVQKFILSSVSEKHYMVQEVVHILMVWAMYHISYEVDIIQIHDTDWEGLIL